MTLLFSWFSCTEAQGSSPREVPPADGSPQQQQQQQAPTSEACKDSPDAAAAAAAAAAISEEHLRREWEQLLEQAAKCKCPQEQAQLLVQVEQLLPCCIEAGISVKYGRKVLQRLQAVAPARSALEAAVGCGDRGSRGDMEAALAGCKNVRCMLEEGLLSKADELLQQLTAAEEEEQGRLAEVRRQQEAAAAAAAAEAAREQQQRQHGHGHAGVGVRRVAVAAVATDAAAGSVGGSTKAEIAVQAGRTHIPEVKSPRAPRGLHHIHHHHHHHHEHIQHRPPPQQHQQQHPAGGLLSPRAHGRAQAGSHAAQHPPPPPPQHVQYPQQQQQHVLSPRAAGAASRLGGGPTTPRAHKVQQQQHQQQQQSVQPPLQQEQLQQHIHQQLHRHQQQQQQATAAAAQGSLLQMLYHQQRQQQQQQPPSPYDTGLGGSHPMGVEALSSAMVSGPGGFGASMGMVPGDEQQQLGGYYNLRPDPLTSPTAAAGQQYQPLGGLLHGQPLGLNTPQHHHQQQQNGHVNGGLGGLGLPSVHQQQQSPGPGYWPGVGSPLGYSSGIGGSSPGSLLHGLGAAQPTTAAFCGPMAQQHGGSQQHLSGLGGFSSPLLGGLVGPCSSPLLGCTSCPGSARSSGSGAAVPSLLLEGLGDAGGLSSGSLTSRHPPAVALDDLHPAYAMAHAVLDDSLSSAENECVVCWSAVCGMRCLPCGHVCMCAKCAAEVQQTSGCCPVCKSQLQYVLDVVT